MTELKPELLAILACPRCRGPLVTEARALRCDACRLRYRVDDGIPILLVDEATPVVDPEGPAAGPQ